MSAAAQHCAQGNRGALRSQISEGRLLGSDFRRSLPDAPHDELRAVDKERIGAVGNAAGGFEGLQHGGNREGHVGTSFNPDVGSADSSVSIVDFEADDVLQVA